MASLFDVGDSSDSEDDVDYVPEAGEVSSDEEDPLPHDDETETNKTSKRKSRKTNDEKYVTETKEPLSDDSKPVSSVDEKKKADDLFKSFLEEAAAEMKETKNESSSAVSCHSSAISSPHVSVNDKSSCPSSSLSTSDKFFEFAGETVTVLNDTVKSSIVDSPIASQEKVDKKSPASASPASASPAPASAIIPSKKRGLDSVLGLIQSKKTKLTVLQKTQLDWKSFKKDEGLEEDLEQFNRGKGGFIERQRFLERSDLRRYEIERDLRMTKKRDK